MAAEIVTHPDLSPLDRPLLVTTFRNKLARTKTEHVKSLRQMVHTIRRQSASSKENLPWLKLAKFGNKPTDKKSLRHDENVESIDGVEVDYDGEKLSMQEAVECLPNIALLGYTSPSHKPDKPRWRLLFPTSETLPPHERRRLVANINGRLGGVLKGDSFALSQSYYFGSVNHNPHHEAVLRDGRYIDHAYELEAGAIDINDDDVLPEDAPRKRKADTTRNGDGTKLMGRIARAGGTKEDAIEALNTDGRLAEWARDRRQVDRHWDYVTKDWPVELKGLGLNEDDMAQAFTARHSGDLRYCREVRRWYEWTGAYWRHEKKALAFHWARLICRELRKKNVGDPMAAMLARARTAEQVEKFAQADPVLAVDSEIWDRDPWLLGTPGGTVDLRTGELQPARQEDFITKATAVSPKEKFDPDWDCFLWEKFLWEATGRDAELVRFLQQWCGYCLTGSTREQALLFLYGPGGNGKGVFVNTVARILGDYAKSAQMETFTASNFDRHPTEIAMLWGARLVTASETEEGRYWAEKRIKDLTGGDPITARFMRQDNFTFTPQFKLTFMGNNKPALRNVDDAVRRRFNIVPFEQKPKHKDLELELKLQAEAPEILAWMIAGCLDWQANGLIHPQSVVDATEAYFAEQDIFSQWIKEKTESGRDYAVTSSELWASWSMFSEERGEKAGTRNSSFPDQMRRRGFISIKDQEGIRNRGFKGLRLRDEDYDDEV